MPNFTDILNKPSAEIEPPKALPVGTYLVVVDGQPEHRQMGANKTDCFEFNLRFMQPGTDVDQQALLETLKGKAINEKSLKHRLFVTEDSVWRLKQFLDHLGIEEGTKSIGERIPEAMGRQVYVNIGHRPSEDGTQLFMEVKNTAKV